MKSYKLILVNVIIIVLYAGCGNNPSTEKETQKEEEASKEVPASPAADQEALTETQTAVEEMKDPVIINDITLNESQENELRTTYGVEPKPGRYWYDQMSGLYGVEGYQAFGFMLPGHSFGTLKRNASLGNSGVFVNGRQLPESERIVWSQLLGYIILPGSYWLDGAGNAGYEGNPVPTTNLYLAAQQNAYWGNNQGGDNFWSSRFGAGNSNADNSQGYVSVPGYGPVGYGF